MHGIDHAESAWNLGQNLIRSHRLPSSAISIADARFLPFETESMDIIYSKMTLQDLPYVKNSGIGVEAFFKEAKRVLRPRGLIYLIVLHGTTNNMLPFTQELNMADIDTLATQFNLNICHSRIFNLDATQSNLNIGTWMEVILTLK